MDFDLCLSLMIKIKGKNKEICFPKFNFKGNLKFNFIHKNLTVSDRDLALWDKENPHSITVNRC